MIGHFIFVAVRSISNGTSEDIFWISHVGTLLGGIGTLLKNRSLASIALVSIAGHHLFWLVDTHDDLPWFHPFQHIHDHGQSKPC